ncbi:MAG: aspartate-alanine antiporter [Muribaculaceae bacterium]|nr:aspartate-alanine antiporter [Muribaculaceae bacterium]
MEPLYDLGYWLADLFRANPVIPIFLTLGIGFWLGSLRLGSFSLGPVTATLIVGVVIGQMDIPIPDSVKSMAFLTFLFAIGYRVGPQFFRSLKGDGLKQICFALVEALICVAVVVVISRLMGYGKGATIGIFAGSQTVSAAIGVGTETIQSMDGTAAEKQQLISIIPACYAVTYIFGTIGTAWIIANLGPRLLGGLSKVKAETAALEAEMDSGEVAVEPGQVVANRPISFRAYRAESDFFTHPRTVSEIEDHISGRNLRHFVERLRIKGEMRDPEPDLKVRKGDIIVLSGRRETIIEEAGWVGPEVTDHELLNFAAENLPVTVSKSGAAGLTVGQLKQQPFMKGVMIHKVKRNDLVMPLRNRLKLQKGDVITLVGLAQDVNVAVPEIGFSDRATDSTDITFISLGIVIGCILGSLTLHLGGIPLSLSTSGGAILAGLVMSWLRSKRPTVGHIPSSVIWFLDNAGLNIFIAVVGITAGPTFISGLHQVGFSLFFVGIACTTLPLIISIFIANKLFRFPAAVALGCVAGSRNAVAALGAIQDSLDSSLPAIGYTVTYAVSSIVLILSGILVSIIG